MSHKPLFGSASHLANMGTSNPRRLKTQSRQFFIASWFFSMETWGRHQKMPQQMAFETTNQKIDWKLHCDRHELLGSSVFTVKNHSNPSLIHNSCIYPDEVPAGLWLPRQQFTLTDSLMHELNVFSKNEKQEWISETKHVKEISFRQCVTFFEHGQLQGRKPHFQRTVAESLI